MQDKSLVDKVLDAFKLERIIFSNMDMFCVLIVKAN